MGQWKTKPKQTKTKQRNIRKHRADKSSMKKLLSWGVGGHKICVRNGKEAGQKRRRKFVLRKPPCPQVCEMKMATERHLLGKTGQSRAVAMLQEGSTTSCKREKQSRTQREEQLGLYHSFAQD